MEIITEFIYKDGEMTETKINMKNINNEWKIIIGDLTTSENKIIKEGNTYK